MSTAHRPPARCARRCQARGQRHPAVDSLLAHRCRASSGRARARASVPWLVVALVIYAITVAASVWRWQLLLDAQDVHVETNRLAGSYLVALFFNNFLPSNIGGDVIRIRDTARPAGSKTLATAVVLVDRGLGLMGLVLVAALRCVARRRRRDAPARCRSVPAWLWAGFLARRRLCRRRRCCAPGRLRAAAAAAPRLSSGVDRQPHREADRRAGAIPRSTRARSPAASAARSSCRRRPSSSTWPSRTRCTSRSVPGISRSSCRCRFVLQMVPVSINGFGVREATFSLYFARLGLPHRVGAARLARADRAGDALLALGRRRLRRAPTPRGSVIHLTNYQFGQFT